MDSKVITMNKHELLIKDF